MDLLDAGFIQRLPPSEWAVGPRYALTARGEQAILALRRRAQQQRAPHHQMGTALAEWLHKQGRVTWENSAFEVANGAVVRPDVLSLVATLNPKRCQPVVHEIKVSRADFWSDVRDPSKRAGYFLLAPQVYYATPSGLVEASEVPAECGLLEQHGTSWVVRRRAPKNPSWSGMSERTWLGLILKPHSQISDGDDL